METVTEDLYLGDVISGDGKKQKEYREENIQRVRYNISNNEPA
jgi:hypothetical protein